MSSLIIKVDVCLLKERGQNMSNTKQSNTMDKLMVFVDKIAGPLTKFGNIPYVRAITAGMAATIGITMIGSIALVFFLLCSDGGLTATALLPFLRPYAGKIVLIQSLSMGVSWLSIWQSLWVLNMLKSRASTRLLAQSVACSRSSC